MRLRMPLVLSAVLASMLISLAGGAGAALSQFSLTFTGKHVADASFPAGLHHVGLSRPRAVLPRWQRCRHTPCTGPTTVG